MTPSEGNQPWSYQGLGSAGDVDEVTVGQSVTVKKGTDIGEAGVVIIAGSGEHARRRSPQRHSHSANERVYLEERFVQPWGFDHASRSLAERGTVFISGSPGSGRQSTARMLLWNHFPNDDAHYRRLTLDNEEDENPLDPESVQQNELLLLDLSVEDEEHFRVVGNMLETFRKTVEAQQAALVVVLPTEWENQLEAEFIRPRVEIDRPPSEKVLRAHLRADELSPPAQLSGELDAHLTGSPMRHLERLADRITQAARTSPKATFESWTHEATHAITDHSKEIAGLVRSCGAEQRALLLAAAMLDDAHTDAAYTAHDTLLDRLSFPKDERHVLERAGLDELLHNLKVAPTPSRHIRFSAPRYARAIREHFWTNYPELRDALRDWVGGMIDQHELTDDDRHMLVARFATQACRTGRVEDLCTLTVRWTRNRTPRDSPFAASALAYGLRDDTHGWKVRRQIYDWSRPDQRTELASVLVAVCADVMADTHPERALVRLRRLAGHRDVDVRQSAQAALARLTEDNRFYRRFLWRMVGWLEHPKRADIELFFAISPADRLLRQGDRSSTLIRSNTIQRQLIACWRAVFGFDDTVWHDVVRDCFAAAATSPDGHTLLDILVEATDQERSQLAKLHVIARDWAAQNCATQNWGAPDTAPSTSTHQPVTPDDVRQQLAVRIDRAQNLRLQYQEKPC